METLPPTDCFEQKKLDFPNNNVTFTKTKEYTLKLKKHLLLVQPTNIFHYTVCKIQNSPVSFIFTFSQGRFDA